MRTEEKRAILEKNFLCTVSKQYRGPINFGKIKLKKPN
jgi:hypothetical protein